MMRIGGIAGALALLAGCAGARETEMFDRSEAIGKADAPMAIPLSAQDVAHECTSRRYTAWIAPGASDEQRDAITSALAFWARVGDGRFSFEGVEEKLALDTMALPPCVLAYSFDALADHPGYGGWTWMQFNASDTATRSGVVRVLPQITGAHLRATMLHETGHAIGLSHTGIPDDVMFHSVADDSVVTSTDTDRLDVLYGAVPAL